MDPSDGRGRGRRRGGRVATAQQGRGVGGSWVAGLQRQQERGRGGEAWESGLGRRMREKGGWRVQWQREGKSRQQRSGQQWAATTAYRGGEDEVNRFGLWF